MAIYPWIAAYQFMELTLDNHAHAQMKGWYETIKQRPAVDRGMKVPS